jgi:hypothetical protein
MKEVRWREEYLYTSWKEDTDRKPASWNEGIAGGRSSDRKEGSWREES